MTRIPFGGGSDDDDDSGGQSDAGHTDTAFGAGGGGSSSSGGGTQEGGDARLEEEVEQIEEAAPASDPSRVERGAREARERQRETAPVEPEPSRVERGARRARQREPEPASDERPTVGEAFRIALGNTAEKADSVNRRVEEKAISVNRRVSPDQHIDRELKTGTPPVSRGSFSSKILIRRGVLAADQARRGEDPLEGPREVGHDINEAIQSADVRGKLDVGFDPGALSPGKAEEISDDIDPVSLGPAAPKGHLERLFEEGRETVSPHATQSLSDPEALEARREKEREMFDVAAGAVDADPAFEDPTAAALTERESRALLGTAGDVAGRGLIGLGEKIEEKTTGDSPREQELKEVIEDTTGAEVTSPAPEPLTDVPGRLAGGTVAFAGVGLSAVAQAPFSIGEDIDRAAKGEDTPTELEGGALETAETFGETQAEMARERPVTTAAGFALPAAAGVPAGVRGFRATKGTTRSTKLKLGDVTSEKGEAGKLPEFETGTGEPTGRAVGEVRQRAADQPDVVQEAAGGDQVLFHTTENPLKGELTVAEGASELPGIFTSPDASPLRLPTKSKQSRPTFGRGDFSTQPEQIAGFESPRISGMPERASGAAHARRSGGEIQETGLSRSEANALVAEKGGERVPDPTTSGAKFLTEEAEPGTAFVRPRGSRSTELEAVLPPESRFQATERIGVEMPGGETIPLDIFRQGDQPAAPGGTGARGGTAGEIAGRSSSIEQAAQPKPRITHESIGGTSAGLGGPTGTTPGTGLGEPTSSASNPGLKPGEPTSGGEIGPVNRSDLTSGGKATSPSGKTTSQPTATSSPFGSSSSTTPTSSSGGSSTTSPPGSSGSPPGSSGGPPGSSGSPPGSSGGPPGSSTPPPTPPPTLTLDVDLKPDRKKKKRRKKELEPIQKTFEFGVATPDEVFTGELNDENPLLDGDNSLLDGDPL